MAEATRKSIFISYRKHDAGSRADLLAELLRDALHADIFLDQANIAPGDDVTGTIEAPLTHAEVVLALVGSRWYEPAQGDTSRLPPILRDKDFVRREISTALRTAKIVIPIYLDDVSRLLPEDLPDDVKGLVESSTGSGNLPSVGPLAIWLREKQFRSDAQPLIDALIQRYGFARKTTVAVSAIRDRPVVNKYLRQLIDEFKHLRLPVRDERRRDVLPVDAVYVALRLRRAEHVPGDPETTWEDLVRRERVAITGEAGSGKSTLLRYIALQMAATRLDQLGGKQPGDPGLSPGTNVRASTSARIPVLVQLPDIAGRLTPNVEQWLDVVWDAVAVNQSVFRSLFEHGEILFLFDGLDEISNADVRRDVLTGIAKLQRLVNPVHGCNAAILTCRDAAWLSNDEYARFERVQIQPMDRLTLDEYLNRWCTALWQADAEPVRQTLSQSLRSSQSSAEIGGNPQIAAMLAMLKHDQALPKQQAVLYELLINRMIKARDAAAHQTFLENLMALAVEMQNGEGSDSGGLDVETANALLGRRTSVSTSESAHAIRARGEHLVNDLVVSTGVLDIDPQRGPLRAARFIRFKHRSFQEFLAARCFAGMFFNGQEPNPLLARVTNPAWAKVLAFASGVLTTFGDPYVKAFLTGVLGAPAADGGRAPGEEELAQWAPRVAAASICLAELSTYELKPQTLAPARTAHELIVPLLSRRDQPMAIRTRMRIAEGLGAIFDPRLDPAARWVAIPAGPFVRGSAAQDAWIQERPTASVALADYWIQRWPVTVAEYRTFVEDARGYENDDWWRFDEGRRWRDEHNIRAPEGWDQNRLKGNCPVTGVSWWEAEAFCAWCSCERTALPAGAVIRLPTEAQWEKAARGMDDPDPAADAKRFPWGMHWKARLDEENYANCSTTGLGVVAPVGLFPAGHSAPFGLWDLAGNVCERCFDGFAPYSDTPTDDPVSRDYTHGHVVRGGAFDSPPLNLRIPYRFGAARDARDERTGFRCAAVAPQRD